MNAGARAAVCSACGEAHATPGVDADDGRRVRMRCVRCGGRVRAGTDRPRSTTPVAALALAALVFYPLAIGLPMLRVARFGHVEEASVFDGTATLLAQGHVGLALIVLLCSIVFPLVKLLGLLILAFNTPRLHVRHRRRAWRVIEWTGRWGMLDVLVVAVLVAAVKLGESVELTAGPGAPLFAAVVVLSLLAAALFDPRTIAIDRAPRAATSA